jgi:hypothetical protein
VYGIAYEDSGDFDSVVFNRPTPAEPAHISQARLRGRRSGARGRFPIHEISVVRWHA